MTAGAEVVCNDVVRNVEIEEKCVANAGLDTCDLNGVGDVATVDGNDGGNGNGDVKDDTDESSYVFVSGGLEVSGGDPDDTGGVIADDFDPKSDSADEVDQLKEEFGIENGETPVDSLASETKGIDPGSITVSDSEVEAVKDDVILENGSTVDLPVVLEVNAIGQDVNGHLDKIPNEEEAVVKGIKEEDDANEIPNVETRMDDIGSPVAVTESDSTNLQSDVMITQSLSTPDLINTTVSNTDCEVMVNESDNPTEDLECQITTDGSESSGSPTEDQVTVDESCKPSEDLTSQVKGDEPESFESSIKEQEFEVSVDGSDQIDSLTDNQEFTISVESEVSNHMEEVDGKSEEHQETEPNYVCDEIKVEDQSVLVSVNFQSENNKAEVADIELNTELQKNLDSGLVLSEDHTDDLANEKVEKFNEILEMRETQISETESVEIEAKSEDMKEDVKIEDEVQESQKVVTDDVQDDLNLEDNTTESANEVEVPLETETNIESANEVEAPLETETNIESANEFEVPLETETNIESANEVEVPLETETNIEPIVHVNTASQHEVSNSMDEPQEGFQPEASSESAENVNLVVSECNNRELVAVKNNDSLSNPDELIVVEQKVEIVAHLDMENRAVEDMNSGTAIENVNASDDDDEKETEVKDACVESVPNLVTETRASEDMDRGIGIENVDVSDDNERETEVKDASVESVSHLVTEDTSATSAENVDYPVDEDKETEVKDAPVESHSTLSFSDTIVNSGGVIEFGSFGHHETTFNIQKEAEDNDVIQSDEIPTSSVEGSVIDSVDVQNEVSEVLPYNFLIKIPRCEDENLRDQIRSAQLLVDEKTRLRDAIRAEIHAKRAKLKAHNEVFNAAKVEETATRRLVRLKRQEIDSVQVVINRMKNAMSVEDIDRRIYNMEHMIQHETLLLKDEKQFIREIKQLKTLRDQLASNMGNQEEIQQAIDQKDQNEERMKSLRKELDSLKDKASKAEAVVKSVGKTYDEESRKERELQAQFRAADDVRQKAYAHLNSLRKLSYDKNKDFRQFKENLVEARQFASHGNKEKLHKLCANQVETFMEQWNNNDEFRKDYVSRCNMNANRRQRAWETAPPVPDDVAPVQAGNVNEKVDNGPGSDDVAVVLPVEENKILSVTSTEKKHTNNNNSSNSNNNNSNKSSVDNISGQKNQPLKTKGVGKPRDLGSDDVAVVAELAVDNINEEENKLTKEEVELAKKAEELRKEEIAAKLKEQRRLEEKAKAIEALERKKRNAEKAQIRAELRARKEAEQKEKEREKRLRKKEKKKTGGGDISTNEVEAVASSENTTDAGPKDTEPVPKEKNKKRTQPPPHFFSKQQQLLKPKPIPPPLLNRNKKRWQQWGKLSLAVAGIFVLFLLGNTRYFRLKFNGLI